MTHDELLEIIDTIQNTINANKVYARKGFDALRAVVELHKPWTNLDGKVVCAECCNYGADREPPCPTVQVIEKELK